MTAPTPPAAPASPSPAAPANATADDMMRMSDSELLADLGLAPGAGEGEDPAAAPPASDGSEPAAAPVRDEDTVGVNAAGRRYDKTTGKLLPESEQDVPGPEGEQPEPAAAAPPAPEGDVLTREERIAKHGFALFDKDGDFEIPEGATLTFKANGRMQEVPVATAIRWAQNGAYNEAVVQEVKELRGKVQTELPQLTQEKERLSTELRAQVALARRLLEDPEFLEHTRERYAAANTPEARVERDRQALAQQRQSMQLEAEARESMAFVTNTIEPTVAQLLDQYPTVTFEEAFGRFTLLATPMLVNGRIPPERLPEVHRLWEDDIGPWMAQRHSDRAAREASFTKQREAAVQQQQVETAKAKRQLARSVAPRGVVPAASGAPARKVVTAEDGVASILDEVRGSAQ